MSSMMRTARVLEPGGLFQIEELAMPQLARDAWLVEAVAAAVRPDLRISLLDDDQLCVCEPAGTVAPCAWDTVGRIVGGAAQRPGVMRGQRVLACRPASQRRQEGFPEYLALPPASLFVLDEEISDLHALCLGPLAQGLSVLRQAGLQAGDSLRLLSVPPAQAVAVTVAALAWHAMRVCVGASDEAWAQRLRARYGERVCTVPALAAGEVPDVGAVHHLTAASFAGVAAKAQDLADMQAWVRDGHVDLSLYEHEVFELSEINLALDAHEQGVQGWANAIILY